MQCGVCYVCRLLCVHVCVCNDNCFVRCVCSQTGAAGLLDQEAGVVVDEKVRCWRCVCNRMCLALARPE